MEVKTLDEKLRARGKAKLVHEVRTVFSAVEQYTCGSSDGCECFRSDGTPLPMFQVLRQIEEKVIERYSPQREQMEVDAFLTKVESLQESVDQVMSELQS